MTMGKIARRSFLKRGGASLLAAPLAGSLKFALGEQGGAKQAVKARASVVLNVRDYGAVGDGLRRIRLRCRRRLIVAGRLGAGRF